MSLGGKGKLGLGGGALLEGVCPGGGRGLGGRALLVGMCHGGVVRR